MELLSIMSNLLCFFFLPVKAGHLYGVSVIKNCKENIQSCFSLFRNKFNHKDLMNLIEGKHEIKIFAVLQNLRWILNSHLKETSWLAETIYLALIKLPSVFGNTGGVGKSPFK